MNETLEKAKREFFLLFVVMIVSLGVSSAMVSDSLNALIFNPSSSLLMWLVKFCEFLVGVFWLIVLIKLAFEVLRIQRNYMFLFLIKEYEKKHFLKDEVKTEAFGFIRDLIGLYRGYYNEIRIVSLLAVLVGFAMVISTVHMSIYGISSLEENIFHLSVAIFALLIPAITFIYVNKNWGRKLLRIRKEEKKLEEFLGGTIEI